MRYVTAAGMREIERAAIGKYGATAAVLMERAGLAVFEEALKFADSGDVLVVCGYGNNGGDGFVAARHLVKRGFNASVICAGRPRPFSREAGDNFKALLETGCAPKAVFDARGADEAFRRAKYPLAIDALFGTGIKGPLDAFYCALIEKINSSGAAVIAVDLPSGLDADTGEPCPVAVRASRTVALGLAKEGFRNPLSRGYTGQVVVADIGIPPMAVDAVIRASGRYAG